MKKLVFISALLSILLLDAQNSHFENTIDAAIASIEKNNGSIVERDYISLSYDTSCKYDYYKFSSKYKYSVVSVIENCYSCTMEVVMINRFNYKQVRVSAKMQYKNGVGIATYPFKFDYDREVDLYITMPQNQKKRTYSMLAFQY